jgi:hypothetical protein
VENRKKNISLIVFFLNCYFYVFQKAKYFIGISTKSGEDDVFAAQNDGHHQRLVRFTVLFAHLFHPL